LDPESGVRDVTWMNAGGTEMTMADWADGNLRCFGMLLDGRARATGVRRVSSDSSMLIVLNSHHEGVGFILPAITGGTVWRLVFDTNAPNHEEEVAVGEEYVVTGRSVLLFERVVLLREPDRRRPRPRRRPAP
jgi:glycogen operon protein